MLRLARLLLLLPNNRRPYTLLAPSRRSLYLPASPPLPPRHTAATKSLERAPDRFYLRDRRDYWPSDMRELTAKMFANTLVVETVCSLVNLSNDCYDSIGELRVCVCVFYLKSYADLGIGLISNFQRDPTRSLNQA